MSATVGLDFERRVSAPALEVRRALNTSLREIGFKITADQLTRLEAKRGSLLGASIMLKKQMAVKAVFELSSDDGGCAIAGHLVDNFPSLGKSFGINRAYREIFSEVVGRLDLALAKLDGQASLSFAQGHFWSKAPEIAVLEQANMLSSKVGEGAAAIAGRAIDGSKETTPGAWKGVDSVTFVSSAGVAAFTLAETQADLGIAVLIASHPGSMPANLSRHVESFAGTVEGRLSASEGRAVRIEIDDVQKPVLEFLHQQAQIRAELPVRTLHICRVCRVERITNPEYEKIARRNDKMRSVMAGVGATITSGGISPTFVLGQVFKLKRLDPEFVCGRCQGMEADERIVTFCPKCADLQRDVVLKLCPKCGFDFRASTATATLWSVAPEPAAEPDAEPGVAEPAAGGPAVAAPIPVAAPVRAGWFSLAPASTTPAPAPTVATIPEPDPASAAAAPQPQVPAAAAAPPLPAAPAPSAWPSPEAVPLGPPPRGKRGGKQCQMCRRDYPSLWRVVIQTPAGFEERFICGTSITCQMRSLAPAAQV